MRKYKILFCYLIFIFFPQIFITNSYSKPLTKEVLQYLDADKSTFSTYKGQFKVLACKLLTYGKIKNLYDEEIIDKYLNQTENKIEFLNLLQEKTQEKCIKTLENNMVIIII